MQEFINLKGKADKSNKSSQVCGKMSDGLTPYSVIMIRLVVQPKFYEVHHTGRSKSVLAEEVVKFLLKEIEVDNHCEPDGS